MNFLIALILILIVFLLMGVIIRTEESPPQPAPPIIITPENDYLYSIHYPHYGDEWPTYGVGYASNTISMPLGGHVHQSGMHAGGGRHGGGRR